MFRVRLGVHDLPEHFQEAHPGQGRHDVVTFEPTDEMVDEDFVPSEDDREPRRLDAEAEQGLADLVEGADFVLASLTVFGLFDGEALDEALDENFAVVWEGEHGLNAVNVVREPHR